MLKKIAAQPQPVSRSISRGFTLTEIAIVLAIVGIILGAIWAAAAMVYENNRTKQAHEQMLTIINNWRSIYGSRKVDIADWTNITDMTANANFSPSEMFAASGTTGFCATGGGAASGCLLQGPWNNSQVSVYSHQSWNGIIVLYNVLQQAACIHLGNSISHAPGLIWMSIDNTAETFPPIGTSALLTTQDVNTQCSNTSNGNYIYAMFSMN